MTSAADRTEARAKNLSTRAKTLARFRQIALGELCSTIHGRGFLWEILSDANVFAQTYIQGSFDATAFQEGKRAAGNRLLADILRYYPASYITMTKENNPSVDLGDEPPEEALSQENPDE